ncbi:hypothetical protein Tco_0133625 [Tanacetum coccineum]
MLQVSGSRKNVLVQLLLGKILRDFFNKLYPPSHTERVERANVAEMLWDQNNIEFEKWIDEGVNNNREPYDDRIEDSESENEVAKIFRIETGVFDFKIDLDVLTKDLPGFKTYEQFKIDWIYKWNEKIPWDHEWYKALVDCKLKEEALENKAELEKSINRDGESSDNAWSNYSPIDKYNNQREGDCTKPDVNHNPYLDIA